MNVSPQLTRYYSLTENPFTSGWKHEAFEETEATCGLGTKAGNHYRFSGSDVSYFEVFNDGITSVTRTIPNLTVGEQTAYYSGRVVGYIKDSVIAVIDCALQIVRIVAKTPEFLVFKGEALIRGLPLGETKSFQILNEYSLSSFADSLRGYTFQSAFNIEKLLHLKSGSLVELSGKYNNFLYEKLFDLA